MIRIGTAGIPHECKGTSTNEGVKCVKALGLSAMEIEFVRSIYLGEKEARDIGETARRLGILLSCHAPYYINLASRDREVQEKSKFFIGKTLSIADACGASVAVVHAGYYSERAPKEAYGLIAGALAQFTSRAKIGVETMGRQKQFGTLDEIISMARDNPNVVPVIDFGHMHARSGGGIKTKDDFKRILDSVDALGKNPIHCHITGIRFEKANEKEHLPISSNQPDFRPLAELLRENGYDITLISESPLIEQDALLFRKWIETQ